MTDACAYYVDADGCGIYPYCPAVAYQPPRIDHTPNIGWNAGANSITELNGNFHTVFSLAGNESGVILGLRSGRVNPVNTGLVEHADAGALDCVVQRDAGVGVGAGVQH